jgi:filamentous hemagglutinin family protein
MDSHGSMNRSYRLVWNDITKAFVAVAEIAKGNGKKSRAGRALTTIACALVFHTLTQAADLPTGGQIVGGNGVLSQSPVGITINQSTPRLALDWQSFSIGAGKTVNFVQPSNTSVALNRVLGSDVTVIQGALNANGQVFLVNPNGVLFTPSAQVNVGGIVASTLNLSAQDFMAGNYKFTGTSSSAIINQGNISAIGDNGKGGTVALIAAKITNAGNLTANQGNVLFGAGSAVTLDLGGPVKIQVTQGAIDALIENGGAIKASGGVVYLTARAAGELVSTVINNNGSIEAQTLATGEQGQIYLLGGMTNDRIVVGGKLDASAPNGGNGGFIETSSAHVNIAQNIQINASSAKGKGGSWLLDPYDYTIDATAASTIVGVLNTGTSVTISTANASSAGVSGSVDSNGLSDITVTSAINKTAGTDATLTLEAGNTIVVNAPISSSAGKLHVNLLADSASGVHDGAGIVILKNSITTNGGDLKFGSNATMSVNGVTTKVGGDVYVAGNAAISLLTAGGSVAVNGEMIVANPSGLTIDTVTGASVGGGGNVLFGGLLNSGNTYDAVQFGNSGMTWNQAVTAAKGATQGAAGINDTYLATINSRLVNSVASYTGSYAGAWLGGFRDLTNSLNGGATKWYWVGGPQKNQAFFLQNNGSGGTAISGQYVNFGSGEPNGTGSGGESALQFFGSAAQWNDLMANSAAATSGAYSVTQYIRETNIANSPVTVSAGSGAVTFSGAAGGKKALSALNVTAGSVATNGISGSGVISIEASTGNISVAGNVSTSSAASDAILLNAGKDAIAGTATGGNVVISNNSTFTTGAGGKAMIYTGSVTASSGLGTAVGVGNSRYNSDEIQANYSTSLGNSGAYAIYREQPIVTVTADNQSKTYDKQSVNTSAYTSSLSGLVNGDTAANALTGSGPTNYTVNGDNATAINANTYAISQSGGTYSGLPLGYAVAYSNGVLTINKAPLTVSGTTTANKVYDGTTSSSTTIGTLTGFIGTETVNATVVGTFNNKNVGTGKSVTDVYTLTDGTNGGLASNYVLADTTTTANITKADLSLTGLTASNKTYDATSVATLTGVATVTGLGLDVVTLSGTAVGAFANANAGNSKAVTVSGLTLDNASLVNYNLLMPTNLTANIAPKTLTATVTTLDKVYDGTTASSTTVSGLSGTIGGQNLGVTVIGTFADKNAGLSKSVANVFTLTDGTGLASNYSLANMTSSANITKADLSVTGLAASNKIYDATTAVTLTGTATVTGLGQDAITLSGTAAGAFGNANAGNNKAVTVSGLTIDAASAINYNLVMPGNLTANITKANLNVTGLAASNKTYDATTVATLTGAASVTGLGQDAITLSGTAAGAFGNANVGNNKAVTVSGLTIDAASAINYNLVMPGNLTANITKANLNVTGLAASNKTYDATTVATLTGTATVMGLGQDAITLSGTAAGAFANANVGNNKAVTVSGLTIDATSAINYNLVVPGNLTANITKANLNVTGLAAINKTYDATTVATLTGTATVTGLGQDAITLSGTAVGAFANPNVGNNKAVTVSGLTIDAASAINYNLVMPGNLNANITKADLNVTGLSASNKTYDATTVATLTGTATVTGLGQDAITLSGTAVGAFANANVGNSKAVTVSGLTLDATSASNYNLVLPGNLTASIFTRAENPGVQAAQNLTRNNLVNTYQPSLPAANVAQPQVANPSVNQVSIGGLEVVEVKVPATNTASSASGNDLTKSVIVQANNNQNNSIGRLNVFVVNGGLNLPTSLVNFD